MKIALFISILFLFYSCGNDHSNKIVGGNLTVYFTDAKDQELAERLALYFKENDLVSARKQDVQLVSVNKKIQLRLIASSPTNVENMPFEERKLLTALHSDLTANVFGKSFDLVICNEKFEPIYTLD